MHRMSSKGPWAAESRVVRVPTRHRRYGGGLLGGVDAAINSGAVPARRISVLGGRGQLSVWRGTAARRVCRGHDGAAGGRGAIVRRRESDSGIG